MSIDARVVGLRKLKAEREVKLTLADRPGGGLAGQETLRILNTSKMKESRGWLLTLRKLIGCDIWGGSGEIMLGNARLAKREGYTGIYLESNWMDVIERHAHDQS